MGAVGTALPLLLRGAVAAQGGLLVLVDLGEAGTDAVIGRSELVLLQSGLLGGFWF